MTQVYNTRSPKRGNSRFDMQASFLAFLRRHKASLLAFAVITGVVFLANAPSLSGRFDPNPLLQRSGLGVAQHNGAIGGLNTIDPNDGFTVQSLGHLAALEWLRGNVPYWNPYEGVGSPLAGEMQSGALSPFVLLFLHPQGNLFYQIIMEIIAGVATFLFLRRLGVRWTVAVLGGVAFALNGAFAWLHNAVFNPIAFLPLLFLGIEIAKDRAERAAKGGWIVIAVAIALSLYAGFPETAFINALLAGGWALVRLVGVRRPTLRMAYFKKLVAGAVCSLLLAAPILVAFLGYLPYADIGWHAGEIGNASLNSIGWAALFMPYIFGPIFGLIGSASTLDLVAFWGSVGGYYAVAMLFFAVVGLFAPGLSRALKIFLAAWIGICLLKTFGVQPVSDILNLIPGIQSAAFYRYAPPSIAFALLVLAAMGIENWFKAEAKKKVVVVSAGTTLLLLAGMALVAKAAAPAIAASSHKFWAVGSVLLAAGIVISLVITRVIVKKKFLPATVFGIVAFEAVLMFAIPQLSAPRISIDTGPVDYLKTHLGLNRFYTLGPIEPNYGSYFEIASINQNDLPVPYNWSKYIEKHLDTNTSPLTFTGTYRADPKGPTAKEEFFRNIDNYTYVGVKFLVTSRQAVSEAEAYQYGLRRVYQNQSVEIFEVSDSSPYYSVLGGGCEVLGQSRDSLSLQCAKAATVVRKELYLPGWRVSINGTQTDVSKEEEIFQRVDVPAGKVELRFSYAPPFIGIAWGMFAVAVVAIAVNVVRDEPFKKLKARFLPR